LLEKVAQWRDTRPTLDPQEVEIGEHYFYLDSAKAEAELGFQARDPQQTLFDTVQYLRAQLPPGHRTVASLGQWQ
jgi:dihydroflavonol-4-reductase